MATILQTDTPYGPAIFHSPLFLVSGAVHVLNALEHLREAPALSRHTARYDDSAPDAAQHHRDHQRPHPVHQPQLQLLGQPPGSRDARPHVQQHPQPQPISVHSDHALKSPTTPKSSSTAPASASKTSPDPSWSPAPRNSAGPNSLPPWMLLREHDTSAAAVLQSAAPWPGFSLAPAPSPCLGSPVGGEEPGSGADTGSGPYPSNPDWEQVAAMYAAGLAGSAPASPSPLGSATYVSLQLEPASSARPTSRPVPGTPQPHPQPHPHPHPWQRAGGLWTWGRRFGTGADGAAAGGSGCAAAAAAPLVGRGRGPLLPPRSPALVHIAAARPSASRTPIGVRSGGVRSGSGLGPEGAAREELEAGACAADVVLPLASSGGVALRGDPASQPEWLQRATVAAGALCRTTAQVAIHPLDTLKTRMQVRLQTPQLRMWRAVMGSPATRVRAVAAWAGAAGARDLLLGLGAALAGVLPASTMYFAVEPTVREWMAGALRVDRESPVCRMTASGVAASLSAFFRVPADVVKHRVQAYAHPSSAHAVRAILDRGGPMGLYAGFGATLLRDVPEMVIQFTLYRHLKGMVEDVRRTHGSVRDGGGGGGGGGGSATDHLLLGGAAGAVASMATTPLDVIKTQLQCGGGAMSVPMAAASVVRAGGPAALFGGMAPRVLQATFFSAIFFSCFEASKAHLGKLAEASDRAAAAAAAAADTPATAANASAPAPQQAAAAVLKPPLPALLPPAPHRRRPGRRLRSRRFDAGNSAGVAAAAEPLWAVGGWAAGGTLMPVALYAYAYAGATAPAADPAAAAAAAAAVATGSLTASAVRPPYGLQPQAS